MKKSQRDRLSQLPRMQKCERWREGECKGSITWEHPFGRLIGGKHVPDAFVIALCEKHAGIGRWWSKQYFNKELNRHLAYQNISMEALGRYKTGEAMRQEKLYLEEKYAHFN